MNLPEPVGLFEAIDSQRTLRYIKPDPIPPEYLKRILDAAVKAPSGGNSQPWEFVVVQNAGLKKSLAELYRRAWTDAEQGQPPPPDTRSHRSARHLMEHMEDAPVMIVACLRVDGHEPGLYEGSSIYPAIQNMLLAARGLGLASVPTNGWAKYEPELRAVLRHTFELPSRGDAANRVPRQCALRPAPTGPRRIAPSSRRLVNHQPLT